VTRLIIKVVTEEFQKPGLRSRSQGAVRGYRGASGLEGTLLARHSPDFRRSTDHSCTILHASRNSKVHHSTKTFFPDKHSRHVNVLFLQDLHLNFQLQTATLVGALLHIILQVDMSSQSEWCRARNVSGSLQSMKNINDG
jgi:hypothetical protein